MQQQNGGSYDGGGTLASCRWCIEGLASADKLGYIVVAVAAWLLYASQVPPAHTPICRPYHILNPASPAKKLCAE